MGINVKEDYIKDYDQLWKGHPALPNDTNSSSIVLKKYAFSKHRRQQANDTQA